MTASEQSPATTAVVEPTAAQLATAAAITVRYGLDRHDGPVPATSSVIDVALQHRSVRRFLPDPVGAGELESIVAAAQSASQSSNLQVWSIVAVRDRARLQRLSEAIGGRPYVAEAPLLLVFVADFHRAAGLARSRGAEVGTVGYLENTLVAFADSGIAAQNALLAAESIGLGGLFVGSLRNNPAGVVAELGLPKHVFPVFALAIGRPDPAEEAGIKPRLPMRAVLHDEQYDPEAWRAGVAEYEERLAAYYADYGKPDYSWARTIERRIGSVAGLHGRETMRDSLRAQGLDSD